jgi:formate hydrogenlyase transcriptional activator
MQGTVERKPHAERSDIKERLGLAGVEMIGASAVFEQALELVETVAPNDSTVLLQGETGTGKELFARAVHALSPRKNGPFVKLNCAAMPAGLVESELFGHERGAFTGAMSPLVGRFQLANKGTLFLDEIGELPLEIQPKLLRALQEQEFERLGSTRTIRTDVRIIAATNQDLRQMLRERRFRPDLYFRLNVFPIVLPPLRAHAEDIPELVQHFVRKLSCELNKPIEHIPAEVMDVLQVHEWSGNIRELENFIHRSVILSTGGVLRPPLGELRTILKSSPGEETPTLAKVEREHILQVLRQTNGLVGGREGAAARLGIPRTTLVHRMRKLGIPTDKFSRLRRNRSRALAASPERDANDEQFRITGSTPVFSEGVV